jgi:hypothetical protein
LRDLFPFREVVVPWVVSRLVSGFLILALASTTAGGR